MRKGDPGGMADATQKIEEKLDAILAALDRVADSVCLLASREMPANHTLSRAEAARLLGCSVRTIDRMIRSGRLESVRRGRSIRVIGASINRVTVTEQSCTRVLKI